MKDSTVFVGTEFCDAVPKSVIQVLFDLVESTRTENEKAKKPDKLHEIFIFID